MGAEHSSIRRSIVYPLLPSRHAPWVLESASSPDDKQLGSEFGNSTFPARSRCLLVNVSEKR